MLEAINKILDWAKTQPANNLLTAALVLLIGGMGYFQWDDAIARRKMVSDAHEMVAEREKARDKHEKDERERTDRQWERVITVMSGVKTEVKKIPVATAEAATKIVAGQAAAANDTPAADSKSDDEGPPGTKE